MVWWSDENGVAGQEHLCGDTGEWCLVCHMSVRIAIAVFLLQLTLKQRSSFV